MGMEQQIRDRAFEIWQREGCPEGCAEQHWAQAEAEINDLAKNEQGTTRTARPAVRMAGKTAKRT